MLARASACCAIIAVFLAAGTAAGQTADLRYRVSAPLQLEYIAVDTTGTSMDGTPMGTITSRMTMSASYSVGMTPAGDSVRVRVVTDTISAVVEGMGQTQQVGNELRSPPSEFTIGASGLNETMLSLDEVDMQNAMTAGVGQAAAANLLLLLPDRAVQVGEVWSDTLRQSGSMDGLDVSGSSIVNGTYAGDTTVAGTSYNVLRYTTLSSMDASGTVQGMSVEQTMAGERTETVLWDPSRRVVVERVHASDMTMTMTIPMAGGTVTMTMNGSGTVRLADGG